VGFLTRLPVGQTDAQFRAFQRRPLMFPVVGYLLGAVLWLPLALPLAEWSVAGLFVLWIFALVGINNLDGLADLADAVVVHGDPGDRRAVMKDTTTGVGATAAIVLAIAGLVLGALALSEMPLLPAAGVILAAEVGAKATVAVMITAGEASHDGIGAGFINAAAGRDRRWLGPLVVPAIVASGSPVVNGLAIAGAALAGGSVWWWADTNLGGLGGDVFGATNELGRLAGLHVGVIVWTLL
jgi:adenosylcobinamide-GDP ribazoletransferase